MMINIEDQELRMLDADHDLWIDDGSCLEDGIEKWLEESHDSLDHHSL